MKLLFQELRKIWRPGILAAIALLGVFYFYLFPSFYIEYFCNGPAAKAQYDLSAGWIAQYGPTIEPLERAQLDGQLTEAYALFNRQIAAIPEAAAEGLSNYKAFCAYREKVYQTASQQDGDVDMTAETLIQRIIGGTNWYTIQELQQFLSDYDALELQLDARSRQDYLDIGYTEAMIRRMEKISSDASRSILPSSVGVSTNEYGKDLAVWCVLSTVLLLSPTLVRDRLYRMRSTQWASRRGRRVLHTQFAAAGLSALLLTALNLTAYAVPFLSKGPLLFRDCGLRSVWSSVSPTPWFEWTYGTYLLVLAGLIAALTLAAAALTVFLSQYSGNYVAMLLKALPLFGAGAVLGSWLLEYPFCFRPLWDGAGPWVPAGTEAGVTAALLLLGLGLCLLACRRQKRRELLNS